MVAPSVNGVLQMSQLKSKLQPQKATLSLYRTFFTASLSQDVGIRASHIEYGEVESLKIDNDGVAVTGDGTTSRYGLIAKGRSLNNVVISLTIIQITTKGRGHNTATPNIVDSQNNPINTSTWRKNLIGENFIESSGDLILPNLDNPTLKMSALGSGAVMTLHSDNEMWHFAKPAGEESAVNHVEQGASQDYARVDSFGTKTPISYGTHEGDC